MSSDAIAALEAMRSQAQQVVQDYQSLLDQCTELRNRGDGADDVAGTRQAIDEIRMLQPKFNEVKSRANEIIAKSEEAEALVTDYVDTLQDDIESTAYDCANADDATDIDDDIERWEEWIADVESDGESS